MTLNERHARPALMAVRSRRLLRTLIGGLAVFAAAAGFATPASARQAGNASTASTYVPMTVQYDSFQTTTTPPRSCFGEDDFLDWDVKGSLKPGESYTFMPPVPLCESAIPTAMASATWDQSQLRLTTTAPTSDGMSEPASQVGKSITAVNIGNSADACLFLSMLNPDGVVFPNTTPSTVYPAFTITNVGSQTAYNVDFFGAQRNSWIQNSYPICHMADADRSGWNDSLKWGMLYSSYESVTNGISGSMFLDTVDGVNYLSLADTPTPDDQVDVYPADFNDDGSVGQDDVDRLKASLGQGNGIPLNAIRWDVSYPDPSCWCDNNNFGLWRRFDLDADGWVDGRDLAIVQALVGKPIPMASDTIPPTVEIRSPTRNSTVVAGSTVNISAFASDNEFVTRVVVAVSGKTLCTVSTAPAHGASFLLQQSPFAQCTWQVPHKQGATYTVQATAYDQAGNSSTDGAQVISS